MNKKSKKTGTKTQNSWAGVISGDQRSGFRQKQEETFASKRIILRHNLGCSDENEEYLSFVVVVVVVCSLCLSSFPGGKCFVVVVVFVCSLCPSSFPGFPIVKWNEILLRSNTPECQTGRSVPLTVNKPVAFFVKKWQRQKFAIAYNE